MKKIAILLAMSATLILGTITSFAQSSKKTVGTTQVAPGTYSIPFPNIPSKIFCFQATVTKVSGTIAGKVYLQRTLDGNYVNVDSLVLADQATNTKIFDVSRTSALSYRLTFVTTGTLSFIPTASYLRRLDE